MQLLSEVLPRARELITESTPREATERTPSWGWHWQLTGAETLEEEVLLAEMLRGAQGFVADIASCSHPRWLVLVGQSGCGKTFLAKQIAEWVKANGRKAYLLHREMAGRSNAGSLWAYAQEGRYFVRWSDYLLRMRSGDHASTRSTSKDWFKVIDDLGVDTMGADGQPTMFAAQKMGVLLDDRIDKWTVVTTNFNRHQFAEVFDPRIASRLMRGGNVIIDATGVRDFWLRREQQMQSNHKPSYSL